jgi:hypothetical protein
MQNRRIIDRLLRSAGGESRPTLESDSMILLFSHVRTGRWASVMPAKLAETLGLTDTLRAIPALTVYLAGGLESQPIELYPPATTEAVREFLVGAWDLAERNDDESAHGKRYDFSVNVYRECYEETQEWHWEGTRQELTEFFALVRRAAAELPLPPPGAKPAQWIVHMQRRESSRLRLAHAAAPHMDHDVIAAPAVILGQIDDKAGELLDSAKEPSDAKFDLPLGLRNVWTFHLHVLAS